MNNDRATQTKIFMMLMMMMMMSLVWKSVIVVTSISNEVCGLWVYLEENLYGSICVLRGYQIHKRTGCFFKFKTRDLSGPDIDTDRHEAHCEDLNHNMSPYRGSEKEI